MRVLWVFAHPEQRSLSGSLRDEGVRTLRASDHEVQLSDLYAMGWNPVVDSADFGARPDRLNVADESKTAYVAGRLSDDIVAEQQKLEWADTVILQFPLWWAGMPAILKGWFDRIFVKGFGYGVFGDDGRTLRYGDGKLTGKRAMVIVTAGAPAATLGPRGINGEIEELLFPLQHGTLWYAGMSVLPPLVIDRADRVSSDEYATVAKNLRERMTHLETATPLPFRRQNGPDYDRDLVLCPEIEPTRSGLRVHYAD